MATINRRIKQLEEQHRQTEAAAVAMQVVIYNPVTGEPFTPIAGAPTTIVWIPDNGRQDE